eukprot:5444451-Pleurochrysis_carterae.AAC.1
MRRRNWSKRAIQGMPLPQRRRRLQHFLGRSYCRTQPSPCAMIRQDTLQIARRVNDHCTREARCVRSRSVGDARL